MENKFIIEPVSITFTKDDSVDYIVAKFLKLLENNLLDIELIEVYSIPPINEEIIKKYLFDWKMCILSYDPEKKDVEKSMWDTIRYFLNPKKSKKNKDRNKKIKEIFLKLV